MKEFLDENDFLPSMSLNIKLYFSKEIAQSSVITHMTRVPNVDLSIVWGKIEKFDGSALGSLMTSIDEKDKSKIFSYVEQSGILWGVVS